MAAYQALDNIQLLQQYTITLTTFQAIKDELVKRKDAAKRLIELVERLEVKHILEPEAIEVKHILEPEAIEVDNSYIPTFPPLINVPDTLKGLNIENISRLTYDVTSSDDVLVDIIIKRIISMLTWLFEGGKLRLVCHREDQQCISLIGYTDYIPITRKTLEDDPEFSHHLTISKFTPPLMSMTVKANLVSDPKTCILKDTKTLNLEAEAYFKRFKNFQSLVMTSLVGKDITGYKISVRFIYGQDAQNCEQYLVCTKQAIGDFKIIVVPE